MMELLCEKARHTLKQRYPQIKKFFLGAFFDDVGLGTDSREKYLKVLEVFLLTCKQNPIRIKLSK